MAYVFPRLAGQPFWWKTHVRPVGWPFPLRVFLNSGVQLHAPIEHLLA